MRILCCIAGLPVGGAERQLLRLIRGLAAAGHEVMLHVFGNHRAVHYTEVYELPAKVHFSDIKRGVRLRAPFVILSDLRKLARDFAPDILFGTLFKASAAVRLARMLGLASARTVVSIRTDYAKVYPWHHKLLEEALLPFCDLWTTNHAGSYRRFHARLGDRVRHIPNGIDANDVAATGADVRRGYEGLLLVALGSVYFPYKNQDRLVEALARVRSRRPDLRFRQLIVGGGAHRDRLAAMVARLELADTVELIPAVQNVGDYLHAADALVHPAVVEGLPNVVLEAMLCGKPVVASRYVGELGIIRDNETGVVASGDDADALAAALLSFLATDAAERRRMGARARLAVKTDYSTERMVAAHIAAFERVWART